MSLELKFKRGGSVLDDDISLSMYFIKLRRKNAKNSKNLTKYENWEKITFLGQNIT